VSADAASDAGLVRIVLRVPRDHRVPRRSISLAARSFASRPALHHPRGHGTVDVWCYQAWTARDTTESAAEDDRVLHARDDDGPVSQVRIGAQPLLRGEQHCEYPAAVVDCERALEAAEEIDRAGDAGAGTAVQEGKETEPALTLTT